jgi:type IV secretion system protein TrbE
MLKVSSERIRQRGPILKKANSPESVPSFAELLPWLCLVSNDWMLCKDGSLLAGYEYTGVDIDNLSEEAINTALIETQRAIDTLDSRYYMWFVVDKRKDTSYRRHEFQNLAGQMLDNSIAAGYDRGEVFTITFRMYVLYTGETGLYAYMENVRRLVNEDGQSMIKALLVSLNPTKLGNAAVLHDARQLDSNLNAAEEGLSKFASMLGRLKLKRLSGWDLENALIQAANITLPSSTGYKLKPGTLLDGAASISDMKFGREAVSIRGPNKSALIANLSLSAYAPNTAKREIEGLLAIQAEFRITHVVKCLGKEGSRQMVDEATRYYEMNQSTFLQRAMAKLSNSKPDPDPGKADLYHECLAAQARMMTEDLGWVYHSVTITLIEQSVQELEKRVNEVSRFLNTITFIRERMGLKASYESCLPGAWANQKRLLPISSEVVTDCLPLVTIGQGNPISPYMSHLYGGPMPALMVTRTRFNTSYHYNPHVGQLGHSLVVMPSGNGKTTFVNFCLSQFQRYPGARVIIFDRDWSCRIMTGLASGKHIDIAQEKVRLNPMLAIKEGSDGRLWAREFILRIIEEGGLKTTAEDRNILDEKLMQLSQVDTPVSLSTVAHVLPTHLHTSLQEWLADGPYGMFDSEVDDLSLSMWTCTEMKQLMATPRLARAFLDHCFRVLSKQLGESSATPTFIYLEEASFLLNNETFLAALDDWLKTFRKKNGFVWMTIQSPQSVSGIDDEKIRATITDNIPNLILGYNQKLENHRELYRSMFAMTDDQIDMIGTLKPMRDYLQVSGGECRVLKTNFTSDMLAVLRSEGPFQELFTQAQKSGREDWREWYLQEALKRG